MVIEASLGMYIPKGLKKSSVSRTVCPVCRGERVVKVKENGNEKEIECPRCDGRGYI